MNKSAYWAWAIKNSVCVIAWIVLAIMFDKWWIALFAVLFSSDLKSNSSATTHDYYRVCDKCGKRSPVAENYNDAIDKAKECGWIIRKDGDKWGDRCPNCQDRNLGED